MVPCGHWDKAPQARCLKCPGPFSLAPQRLEATVQVQAVPCSPQCLLGALPLPSGSRGLPAVSARLGPGVRHSSLCLGVSLHFLSGHLSYRIMGQPTPSRVSPELIASITTLLENNSLSYKAYNYYSIYLNWWVAYAYKNVKPHFIPVLN